MTGPAHRVYLHVGSAKTGTTYLQGLLWHHRNALREAGVDYVADAPGDHFLAAIDLRDVPVRRRPQTQRRGQVGRGRRTRARSRGHGRDLARGVRPAPADVAARAVADLAPAEVHLVLTTRDLLRQVTADWQERIKHGSRLTFAEYVDTVLDPRRHRGRPAQRRAAAAVLAGPGRRRRARALGCDGPARPGPRRDRPPAGPAAPAAVGEVCRNPRHRPGRVRRRGRGPRQHVARSCRDRAAPTRQRRARRPAADA